jgi:GxxExxY protein
MYLGQKLGSDLKLDLLVERCIAVELKSVDVVLPVHRAQMITHLRLSGLRLGLLIDFNVKYLRERVKRLANGMPNTVGRD